MCVGVGRWVWGSVCVGVVVRSCGCGEVCGWGGVWVGRCV